MKKILFRYFIPLLTVMSLSACNKEYDGSEDLSYMWFDVSGKVVNEAGKPVPEISVYAESAEVVKTDAAGMFSVRGGGLPASTTAIRCIATRQLLLAPTRATTTSFRLTTQSRHQLQLLLPPRTMTQRRTHLRSALRKLQTTFSRWLAPVRAM